MTDKKTRWKDGYVVGSLENRNRELLAALKSAKRLLKYWYTANWYKGEGYWKSYQNLPQMKRINKALKND